MHKVPSLNYKRLLTYDSDHALSWKSLPGLWHLCSQYEALVCNHNCANAVSQWPWQLSRSWCMKFPSKEEVSTEVIHLLDTFIHHDFCPQHWPGMLWIAVHLNAVHLSWKWAATERAWVLVTNAPVSPSSPNPFRYKYHSPSALMMNDCGKFRWMKFWLSSDGGSTWGWNSISHGLKILQIIFGII